MPTKVANCKDCAIFHFVLIFAIMTQITPQPDLDINPGSGVGITDSSLYRSTEVRVRNAGNFGWWPTVWSTSGSKTTLTMSGASEVSGFKIFDTAQVTYDGGVIYNRVELYMACTLLITTSGNTDWTIDGSPIAGYFPVNIALLMLPGQEYVLAGTMETPGVSRSLRIQNYATGTSKAYVWSI